MGRGGGGGGPIAATNRTAGALGSLSYCIMTQEPRLASINTPTGASSRTAPAYLQIHTLSKTAALEHLKNRGYTSARGGGRDERGKCSVYRKWHRFPPITEEP